MVVGLKYLDNKKSESRTEVINKLGTYSSAIKQENCEDLLGKVIINWIHQDFKITFH
jgi:hypothetical protein